MNLNLNYDECMKYIRNFLRGKKDKLMPHQELMLKAWCDGKIVRTGRGIGRTFAADLLGKYIAHKIDSENDAEEPDIKILIIKKQGKRAIIEKTDKYNKMIQEAQALKFEIAPAARKILERGNYIGKL